MKSWKRLALVFLSMAVPVIAATVGSEEDPLPPERAAGRQLYQAGRYEDALAAYLRSIAAQEEGPSTPFPKTAYYWGARTAWENLSECETAVSILRQAARLWPDNHDVYFKLGQVYQHGMRRYADAIVSYRTALDLAVRVNAHADAASYADHLSSAYKWQGIDENTDLRFENARRIEEVVTEGLRHAALITDPQTRAYHEQALGKYRPVPEAEQPSDYETRLATALENWERLKREGSPKASDWELTAAALYFELERYPEAATHFAAYIRDTDGDANKLMMLAQCHLKMGQLTNAFDVAMESLTRLDAERAAAGTDEAKLRMIGRILRSNYGLALGLARQLGKSDAAFEIIERSKARALLDLLTGADVQRQEAALAERTQAYDTLLARETALASQVAAERAGGQFEQAAASQRSLILVEDTRAKAREDLELYRRELKSLTTAEPAALRDVQRQLGDLTLIQYWWPNCVAVATRDRVTVRSIEAPSKADIDAFLAAIGEPVTARGLDVEPERAGVAKATPRAQELAQALYRKLIEPIAPLLTTPAVCVIPDGELHRLPFQALHDGERYFVEGRTVSYAPSAGVLLYCRSKHAPVGESMLAVGNPSLGESRYRLVHAEEEAGAVGAGFAVARTLVGAAATETEFARVVGDYPVVHLACHGLLNLDDPMRSALRLAPDDANDGFLHASEVLRLRLRAALVTLSACETARGEITHGSEVIGLTRAFMFAGAPSVVSSLWRVDDAATATLMADFYGGLKTHGKAEALRAAQTNMIAAGREPFYWAAFCLYGDNQ